MSAFTGNSRHSRAPLSALPGTSQHGGMQGTQVPSTLTCVSCLLILSGCLLLCFLLGVSSPGLSLNLSSPLGFPRSLPLGLSCVLQASELGMTSAFYKYILTTMVRTLTYTPPQLPPTSLPYFSPASGLTTLLLGPRTFPSCIWMVSWRTPPTSWAFPCSTPPTPSTQSLCAASTCPGGRTVKPAPILALR